MKPAKVIGNVTLSQAAPVFKGARWLVLSPQGPDELTGKNASGVSRGWTPVVYDDLGAGVGENILYVEGSEATQPFDHPIPLDAINVAILDQIHFKPQSR